MSETKKEYQQAEAFNLMWYRCEKCGTRERIWNSRDAITPFTIGCAVCDGDMTHVDGHLDRRAPDHKPQPGDRIFVDLTPEVAAPKAREYVERYWDDPKMPMSAHPVFELMTKEQAAAYFVEQWCSDWGGHSPHVHTVTEAS